jgi:hypothetical protein
MERGLEIDMLIERKAGIAQEPTPLGKSTALLFARDPYGEISEYVGPARANKH